MHLRNLLCIALFMLLLITTNTTFAQSRLEKAKSMLKKKQCQLALSNYTAYVKETNMRDNNFADLLEQSCGTKAYIKSSFSADDDPLESLPGSINKDKVTQGNQYYKDSNFLAAAKIFMDYMEDNLSLFDNPLNASIRKDFLDKIHRCLGDLD